MKYTASIFAAALACCAAHTALAHVVVTPQAASADSYQTFSISVPSERQSTTTSIRILIPDGATAVRPTVKPGWAISEKTEPRASSTVTEILWTGGEIPPGFRDDFSFSIRTPHDGALAWKAYQTYEDDAVVSWDQAPAAHNEHTPGFSHETATSGPYSLTTLSAAAHADHAAHDSLLLPLIALAISIGTFATVMKKTKKT